MQAESSASLLSLSVTWSFRNHSNILFFCSRNIYY